MASKMLDLPRLVNDERITSTIGAHYCCQVEERSDDMVTLERFKVLQLNRKQP